MLLTSEISIMMCESMIYYTNDNDPGSYILNLEGERVADDPEFDAIWSAAHLSNDIETMDILMRLV